MVLFYPCGTLADHTVHQHSCFFSDLEWYNQGKAQKTMHHQKHLTASQPTSCIPPTASHILLWFCWHWEKIGGFTQAGGELNCTREGDGKIEVVLNGVGGHQILYTWEPSNAPFYITDLLTELRNGIDVNSFPSDYWGPGSGWRENNFPACLVCSQLSPRKRHCISISTHCMPS